MSIVSSLFSPLLSTSLLRSQPALPSFGRSLNPGNNRTMGLTRSTGSSQQMMLLTFLLKTFLESRNEGFRDIQSTGGNGAGFRVGATTNRPSEPTQTPASAETSSAQSSSFSSLAPMTEPVSDRVPNAPAVTDTSATTGGTSGEMTLTSDRTGITEPRDGELIVGGYRWLGRSMDKARLKAQGKLDDLYLLYPCPQDQALHKQLGIDSNTFMQIVANSRSDQDVLTALRARGIRVSF